MCVSHCYSEKFHIDKYQCFLLYFLPDGTDFDFHIEERGDPVDCMQFILEDFPDRNCLKVFLIISSKSVNIGRFCSYCLQLPTGWTVRGSNPGGARFSVPVQTGPGAHTASCTMGTGSFQGVRCFRGVTLTPHPLLLQRSNIE